MNGPEKIELLTSYAEHFRFPIFIETGSGDGATCEAMVPYFERLYTIDCNLAAYPGLVERFVLEPKVLPILGDSVEYLDRLCEKVRGPKMFWLDAHTEAISPLLDELYVLNRYEQPHVVLIDDVDFFDRPGWPRAEEVYKALRPMHIEEHDGILIAT